MHTFDTKLNSQTSCNYLGIELLTERVLPVSSIKWVLCTLKLASFKVTFGWLSPPRVPWLDCFSGLACKKAKGKKRKKKAPTLFNVSPSYQLGFPSSSCQPLSPHYSQPIVVEEIYMHGDLAWLVVCFWSLC